MEKREIEMDNIYSTQDLLEASAIAIFQKPIRLDKNGNHFLFVFNEEAKTIANQYWADTLTGNIRAYANSIKSMKDWLWSGKRKIDMDKRNVGTR